MKRENLHFETLQLHVGQERPDPVTDAPTDTATEAPTETATEAPSTLPESVPSSESESTSDGCSSVVLPSALVALTGLCCGAVLTLKRRKQD